eukprot:13946888-Alexandrium_andersonii.AAC.1
MITSTPSRSVGHVNNNVRGLGGSDVSQQHHTTWCTMVLRCTMHLAWFSGTHSLALGLGDARYITSLKCT